MEALLETTVLGSFSGRQHIIPKGGTLIFLTLFTFTLLLYKWLPMPFLGYLSLG